MVRIDVANAAEEQRLGSRASLDLCWLHRDGAAWESPLQAALADIEWPTDGRSVFAWAGCEFRDFVAIRRHFRKERGLARENHLAVAYWRRGLAGDDARKAD